MEEWALYVVIWTWGVNRRDSFDMPDFETCITAVREAKSDISDGADTEAGIAWYCAPRK